MFTDFQYGTEMLSDYELIVCQFDSANGAQTVSTGSQLTFNTVKAVGSNKFNVYGSLYNEVYTATFQCCKVDKNSKPLEITAEEYSQINRWLNRNNRFNEFKVNGDGYEDIRYMGSFNIQAVKINEVIYGIECSFTSNSPYAYANERTISFTGKQFRLLDSSDEIGEIYPHTTIICLESGDLKIQNASDNEIMMIKNCKKNEVITIDNDNKIIVSSDLAHKVSNDFNYNYLKIINKYGERNNSYSSTLNINITFKYSPVRKVGI